MTHKKINEYNIDLSSLGIVADEDAPLYFCTPKGARVIGWAGVDGIHYCFVRGFSDMVFAISPMNLPGNYVHPVARNFTNFLQLLLACGDAAALEQAWSWDEAQFDAFLADNPPTNEQRTVLDEMQEKLHLMPMEHPFAYLKELHAEFDYGCIPYTKDYYDFVPSEPELPPWKVYFESGFWGRRGQGRPGVETPIQRRFNWDGLTIYVPSVYSCAKGFVVDICIEVSAKEIRTFMDKWNLSLGNDGSAFNDEQQMQADAENPLSLPFTPEIMMNGKMQHYHCGYGLSWNPCIPEENNMEERGVLEHYGLDPSRGWVMSRYSFPWERSRRPQVRTLSLTLHADAIALPGPKFQSSSPYKSVSFTQPKTGVRHILTVQEYERQQLPERCFGDDSFEYPTHYTAISYTLSPDLPQGDFSLVDRVQGDHPIKKQSEPNGPEVVSDCMAMAIGIIGGADGPTAIFMTESGQGELRTACSSPHFSAEYEVEWQMVFHEKNVRILR